MSDVNPLPNTVVHELEKATIPQDSVIFFQDHRWVYRTGLASSTDNRFSYHPIDSLGPFDIHPVDTSFVLYPQTLEYTILKIGKQEVRDERKVTGIFAPIAEVTLEGYARDTANIPIDTTHFCWLYPRKNMLSNEDIALQNTHELNFLKIGGFAYFNANENNADGLRLVRVNSLTISAKNGLTFEGPFRWKKEFTEQLRKQQRFQPVTLTNLHEKGAQYFAFINPYECFSNETHPTAWTPSPHGAFAYLFNDDYSPHPFDCYFSVADNCLGVAPSDEE